MKKTALLLCAGLLAAPLGMAHARNPIVVLREKQAAEKAKEKQNPPSPPAPPQPEKDKDKDRDKDKNRDRDDWRRNHDRNRDRNYPVYIPTYPSPYPYPQSYPYPQTYPYPPSQPYFDNGATREVELLETVAKQMRFALRQNEVLKPFKLDTDTVGDSVEIHGTVDTIAQMQLALDVARNIDPRTRIVITRIQVRQK